MKHVLENAPDTLIPLDSETCTQCCRAFTTVADSQAGDDGHLLEEHHGAGGVECDHLLYKDFLTSTALLLGAVDRSY